MSELKEIQGNFEHILPEVIFEAVEKLGGRCSGRFLPLNALENRVYDVEMEEGFRVSNVIAKFYRPGKWNREEILAEHCFLGEAMARNVPVVCPLADDDGNTLFKQSDIFCAFFPKIRGRVEPELNEARLKKVGHYLARLHEVGKNLKKVKRGILSPETYGKDAIKTLREIDVIPEQFKSRVFGIAEECCEAMMPLFKNAACHLVHGDCHVGNVLWNGDQPTFVDFDDIVYSSPAQDLWMLAGGTDEYGLKNWSYILSGYEEIKPFDYPSIRLAEALRALRVLHFSAWIARRRCESQFMRTFPYFGTEKYWFEQIETLSTQLEIIRNLLCS